MINNSSSNKNPISLNLNRFFQKIFFKKQYIRQLKNKITLLNNIKKNKYKVLTPELFKISNNFLVKKVSEVSYIIDFSFSKTNTTLHVMDCSGKTKFFYSAGLFDFKGNQKTFQSDAILKKFYKILVSDLLFLKSSKIAIHFKNKNINYKISWFLKKLRSKFFIAVVKFFTVYPYNGCRRKKQKRKKFKTRRKRRYG
jgi:ribosomal protein S11